MHHFMRQRAEGVLGLALADVGRVQRDFMHGRLAAVLAEAVSAEIAISLTGDGAAGSGFRTVCC